MTDIQSTADRLGVDPSAGGSSAHGGGLRRFTTSAARRRLLVAVATGLLMVCLAAPTTLIYLDQRSEIVQLEASIREKSAARDELRAELELWDDPEHVRQQAAQRLQMVEPGQRSYLVVGADEVAAGAPPSSAAVEEAGSPAWADALWESVKDSAWPQQRSPDPDPTTD